MLTRHRSARAAVVMFLVGAGCLTFVSRMHGQSTLTADERKYRPGRPDLAASGVEVLPVQGNVFLIATGKSANIVAQVGDQGVLLVDSGVADVSDRVLAEIAKLTNAPIKGIVTTTTDMDHLGGNERLAKAGQPMFAGSVGTSTAPQAQVFAHERALNQISLPTGHEPSVPSVLWPTDTFVGEKKKLFFNREPIELQRVTGHTIGDLIVWFRRSDVIAAGDAFSTTGFPRFDPARAGTMQGVLDALNRIIDIAVAEVNQQGGTRIVPSHGRIANQSDVVEYRDMATIVRDRVRDAIVAGKTLDQVKAAKLTLEYDGIYATPAYSGDAFVEAVYADIASTMPKSAPLSRRRPGKLP